MAVVELMKLAVQALLLLPDADLEDDTVYGLVAITARKPNKSV